MADIIPITDAVLIPTGEQEQVFVDLPMRADGFVPAPILSPESPENAAPPGHLRLLIQVGGFTHWRGQPIKLGRILGMIGPADEPTDRSTA